MLRVPSIFGRYSACGNQYFFLHNNNIVSRRKFYKIDYFVQARSMQELARKNFENLRSPGEDKEPEVKKRGRRPGITSNKKQLGYFPVDLAGSDSTLAPVADSKPNFALDFLTKGVDKPGNNNVSEENHNAEALRWGIDEKPYRDNDFSGRWSSIDDVMHLGLHVSNI